METDSEGHLPFLGLDIYRRPDGSLGHKVYRKPTHTNLYLNTSTPSPIITHPINKRCYPPGYTQPELSDEDSLQAELVFLGDVFF
jgi:hypothetical protein